MKFPLFFRLPPSRKLFPFLCGGLVNHYYILLWCRQWLHSFPNNDNKWKFNNDTGTSSFFCSSPISVIPAQVVSSSVVCFSVDACCEWTNKAFNAIALCDARPRHSNSLSTRHYHLVLLLEMYLVSTRMGAERICCAVYTNTYDCRSCFCRKQCK